MSFQIQCYGDGSVAKLGNCGRTMYIALVILFAIEIRTSGIRMKNTLVLIFLSPVSYCEN